MTPSQYWEVSSDDKIMRMCRRANTSVENFKKIALYNGSAGKKLAAALAKASNQEMTELEILYPERYL
jgi:acetyl esterase/lipase